MIIPRSFIEFHFPVNWLFSSLERWNRISRDLETKLNVSNGCKCTRIHTHVDTRVKKNRHITRHKRERERKKQILWSLAKVFLLLGRFHYTSDETTRRRTVTRFVPAYEASIYTRGRRNIFPFLARMHAPRPYHGGLKEFFNSYSFPLFNPPIPGKYRVSSKCRRLNPWQGFFSSFDGRTKRRINRDEGKERTDISFRCCTPRLSRVS